MAHSALLVLADGTVYQGVAAGYLGESVGELIFNTSMTGYQEIITDPSYAKQIITFTYPHIGNVGINVEDIEADEPRCAGIVIRELPTTPSNWRSQKSLCDYLQEKKIPAIAGIDTRHLTQHLRDHGAQNACIMAGNCDENRALKLAREFAGLNGMDLAIQVTTDKPYSWSHGVWRSKQTNDSTDRKRHKVIVYDFGVKQNILRILHELGCELTIVPANTSFSDLMAQQPDGVVFSNGPGDPAACGYAIDTIANCFNENIPVLGICLGFQLLALAAGATTQKMKFGHHGANHPVQCVETKKVYITSQNHGFAVSEKDLPEMLQITHRSLFDGSLQGLKHKQKPAFGLQGHPEASPGPHESSELFNEFIQMMHQRQAH